ncbi:hypothetical protein LH427_12585 [Laribacter hongkongensis]|uniref:hypothetical protein n=1 Tax=Laribacter hongkongensis TaxID=168471 RepID=UPI001EFDDBA4|nr:hypothetical protein [Laribacter hongkongensis]MCG8998140.1 hypothetical protein [Laribacter hongkongensis]MCG9062744.1 hypothetical protein [Laribacter hongkongensis]
MSQVASIQSLRQPPPAEMQMPQVSVGLTNLQGFELAQRAAKLLASSTLVPKEYQGNLPNCVIALNMAQRVGADPLMVMQNLVIVHGRPTWSAQFLIATVNTCGRFSALRFEFFGERNTDEWGCRAWAIEKATGEKLVGSDVTIGIARKEGWYGKNGSKWQSIPQQMLMYRAGGWWTRAFAPELSMGLQTADEAGDIYDATPDASGTYSVSMDDLHRTEASIEQQAAQEAPSTAAPVDVDPQTGEVIGKDEADHSPDELGLQDALAAIKAGDLVVAQDIARGLSETDRAIVDQAIENKRTTRRRPAAGLDLE